MAVYDAAVYDRILFKVLAIEALCVRGDALEHSSNLSNSLPQIRSWLMFATIYFTIATRHGDFMPGNLGNPEWKPCIVQVESFGTAYLFSVETQHTIGERL